VGRLLLAVVLLLLNAFFVGAEFSVISARRSQIEPLADAGSRAARTAISAMERISLMLAAAQLGITVCSLGLGAVAEPAVGRVIEAPFHAFHVPEDLFHPIAFVLSLAIVIYLHVVIGEMVPKNLALAGPDRAVLLLAPPLVALARVVNPVIVALNALANGALWVLRIEPKSELASTYTADEVASIVDESTREGLLDDEHGLLAGALEFSERLASDVMVPLDRLVTVPAGSTPAQVERLVTRTGFSRFPVVRTRPDEDGSDGTDGSEGSADSPAPAGRADLSEPAEHAEPTGEATPPPDVVGYLHLKDLLYADDDRHEQPIPEKRVRSLVSVSTADEVEEALETMQRAGTHLARVVSADGATAGVLFLEDVLEELVGEVRDAMRRVTVR
jgi:CBS domain containing-hemolysin-like protein